MTGERHTAAALWRRLDAAGHDACRLDRTTDGWELHGAAVFLHDGTAARLDYETSCDMAWRSLRGRVRGWIGDRRVSVDIGRGKDGTWTLNGTAVPGLEGCLDLDFGFTPATNLFQVRRTALREGEAISVPAAWFDPPVQTLLLLPQRYERRGRLTYWYEAPTTGYAGLLELDEDGFIRRYPGLWEREE